MKTFLLLLSVGLLPAVALAQQGPLGPRRSLLPEYRLLQRDDQGLVGRGKAYRADFQAEHVEFVPAVPMSPVSLSLRLRAEAAGRGTMQLLAAPSLPEADGLQVRYVRGAVVETYDVRSDALEQSFVFRELPPGDGDLVVDVRVATDLPVAAIGDDSVLFANQDGGAEIHGVVGRDGEGHTCGGSMAYRDGLLSLRLPAAFVRTATLPLVLDPLVTPRVLANTGNFTNELYAAYDASTARYLVAWCFNGNNNATEIRGLLTDGVNAGTPLVIQTTNRIAHLSVANDNLRNTFVVAWDQEVPGGPFQNPYRAIFARGVQAGGTLGPVAQITALGNGNCQRPHLASNADPTAPEVALVYLEDSNGRAIFRNLRVDAAANVSSLPTTTLSNPLYTATGVGIARTGDATNRYLVAWGENTGAANVLRRGVYTLGGLQQSVVLSSTEASTVVDVRIDGDGAAGEWALLAMCSTAHWPQPSIEHVWLDNGGPGMHSDPRYGLPSNTGSDLPAVALTPRFVHTVHQSRYNTLCVSGTPNCWESTASVLARSGCRPCTAVVDFAEWARPALLRPVAYGASGFSPEDVKLIYTDPFGGVNFDIFLCDFTTGDGAITDLGGGCGGATARASSVCAHVGGSVCLAELEGATTNNVFLLLGADRLDARGCGSCVLVPDPFTAFVIGPLSRRPGLSRVETEFTVPNVPGLVGLRLYEQWLLPDTLTPGCASFPFDLSNALQVTIN